VIAELSRADREVAADLCGGDCLSARLDQIDHVRHRLVFGNRFINPFLDGGAATFVCLVADARVAGEEFIAVICLAGGVRSKECGGGHAAGRLKQQHSRAQRSRGDSERNGSTMSLRLGRFVGAPEAGAPGGQPPGCT